MHHNITTGRYGEELAKQFLIRHGYEIVTGHWQKRVGEIDIVAYIPSSKELVFVEVKTRHGTEFGYPEEKVTREKLQKINKTAQWFLITNQYPDNQQWRIDIISIIINQTVNQAEITHFKNIVFN
jgi:putative endonuclease